MSIMFRHFQNLKINSATGTRTRVARVRAAYPNQLDYSGHVDYSPVTLKIQCLSLHSRILPPGIEPGTFRV